MSLQTEQRTPVHIQSPCAVIVREVDGEMVGNLLYLTGFTQEEYEDEPYKPRVELTGNDAIVRFFHHEDAKLFLELVIGTGAHELDWYLTP